MPKILIAPLDWGLGHAARCIPIIYQLQKNGFTVIIAGEGAMLKLLIEEFPSFHFLPLRGYRIRYSENKRFFTIKILSQLPKIFRSIKREQKWLDKTIQSEGIDIVISDNRYGLFSKKVPCIFITHQLQVAAPSAVIEMQIQKIIYAYINHFSVCWVPDYEGAENIAGRLSHPPSMPSIPVKYIGMLSRFGNKMQREKKYDWLIVLSGPEPQRSILEKKLFKIIPQLAGNILFIRGKPLSTEEINVPPNCILKNHLTTTEMQQAFEESNFIISRSGYTTVIEILSLQKKSILIPTPGQTEQEYLARHLMKQRWSYAFAQEEDILFHLQQAAAFDFKLPQLPAGKLESAISESMNAF